MVAIELTMNLIYFLLSLYLPGMLKINNKEVTRKMSHILCGNWVFIFAYFNRYFLTNIVVNFIMIIMMSLSYKYNLFKSVERKNQTKSFGTIYFFISLLCLAMVVEIAQLDRRLTIIYYFPLIYGDAFAAIFGKKFGRYVYKIFNNPKTFMGNVVMFLVSFCSMVVYNFFFINNVYTLIELILISLIASLLEAISVKGTDNFTIPIITMVICKILI